MTSRGFTLIETIIGSAVFLVVALSAYKAFTTLMEAMLSSQAKIAATAVANERIEIIRNMPYTNIGTVGGIPSGKVVRNINLVRGNYSFNVTTTIRSVDDPFDGTIGGTPGDSSPADYKSADLDITCTNCKLFNPLKFTTLFAPQALETGINNGALFIQVFDAGGLPVAGASVNIVNTQPNPDIVVDDITDNSGWVKIVDAIPGTNAYAITVTKSGYSQDQTYIAGGVAGASPIKPNANVAIGLVTQTSFAIDKVSSITANTVDASCVALPNTGFSITGTKLIGSPAVLKYPVHTFTSDSTGTLNIPNLEWDTYSTLLTSATLDLAGTNPQSTFSLTPNTALPLRIVAVPHSGLALLVSIKDASGNPIDGATVRLQKTGFDQTKTTNNSVSCATPGQVFWNGLSSGTYTLTVTKAGFQVSTTSVAISANWKNQIVTLTP